MPPVSQIIAVAIAVTAAVALLGARTWSALSWAGRRDEARRFLRTLIVCSSGLVALTAAAGAMVGFDIVAYHGRARAGQAPWGPFYGACLLLGMAVLLWLKIRRATPALEPPPAAPAPTDGQPDE